MSTWIGTDVSGDTVPNGTYRFWFTYPAKFLVPDVTPGKSIDVGSKHVTLKDYYTVDTEKKLAVVVEIRDNGTIQLQTANKSLPGGTATTQAVPILAIAGVVAGLIGLTLIFLTFDRIEKMIDSPAGSILWAGVGIAVIVFAVKAFRSS
jgi:hypothetical protein